MNTYIKLLLPTFTMLVGASVAYAAIKHSATDAQERSKQNQDVLYSLTRTIDTVATNQNHLLHDVRELEKKVERISLKIK